MCDALRIPERDGAAATFGLRRASHLRRQAALGSSETASTRSRPKYHPALVPTFDMNTRVGERGGESALDSRGIRARDELQVHDGSR